MRTFIRSHPVSTFVPLAFVLSWYPTIVHLLGVERASGINPLGPLVAALLVSSAFGWPEVKKLLSRLNPFGANWRWHLLALLLPVVLAIVAVSLTALMQSGSMKTSALPAPVEILPGLLIGLVFVGLGEEPGWRGFLLPTLAARSGWLRAALIVGVVWTLWHIPLWGGERAWINVPPFIVSAFAASVVLAWLFRASGGNVFVCMLMHATVNAVGAGFLYRMFEGVALTWLWWVNTIVWVLVAVVLGRALMVSARNTADAANLTRAGPAPG